LCSNPSLTAASRFEKRAPKYQRMEADRAALREALLQEKIEINTPGMINNSPGVVNRAAQAQCHPQTFIAPKNPAFNVLDSNPCACPRNQWGQVNFPRANTGARRR